MIKKIFGLICIFALALTLVGCSNEPTPAPEPTREPAAIHNVGDTIRMDSTSFVIRESWRVSAEVDKHHNVYGIHVVIRNYDTIDVSFKVSDIVCYAGSQPCEIYTGFTDALTDTIIPAQGKIDGWIYFKIPERHDGLSFSYIYDSKGNHIMFVFAEG